MISIQMLFLYSYNCGNCIFLTFVFFILFQETLQFVSLKDINGSNKL